MAEATSTPAPAPARSGPLPAVTEDGGLVFNGVDESTGEPFFEPLDPVVLGEHALEGRLSPFRRRELDERRQAGVAQHLGLRHGIDPRHLDEAGWGVIFAEKEDPAVRDALRPLLEHRRRRASRSRPCRYRELAGRDGYRAGESKLGFLGRHGVGPGPADPDRMPYYLLLVGDPGAIPWRFQHQLDVAYAVGRLSFDTPEEYARYAESVVAAERGDVLRPRRAVLFGPRRDGDRATELMHDELVLPMTEHLTGPAAGWQVEAVGAGAATRQRLAALLGGGETPALLFAAAHGLCYRPGDPRRRERQGALACQRPAGGPVSRLAAEDLDAAARLRGLILFLFACYSAGIPGHGADTVAERPFVARLPQRLLGHPGGGALAVVGHVDRAWTFSFWSPQTGPQVEVFRSSLRRLLAGYPLGAALEYFHQRYAELRCDLAELKEMVELGGEPDLWSLGSVWTACQDARNYVILGDPAVRLAVPPRPQEVA